MSFHPPPLTPSTGHRRKQLFHEDIYQKPYSSSYDQRWAASSSSPPSFSSSPPSTPFTARHSHRDAYIRSSPDISVDVGLRGVSEHLEDPRMSWNHRYSVNASWKTPVPIPDSRRPASVFISNDLPPASDFTPSEYSEVPDVDSDSAPGQSSSGVFSDSEEDEEVGEQEGKHEGEDDDDIFGLRLSRSYGHRTTFFRTSAERGQWKSDPMPFRKTPAPPMLSRKSAPAVTQSTSISRVATPTLANKSNAARPISEPAPSTGPLTTTLSEPEKRNGEEEENKVVCIPADDVAPSQIVTISAVLTPEEDSLDSPSTLPSLTSDRESSEDADVDLDEHEHREILPSSSPLPPSSPPLSPMSMSFSVGIMSRSSSPLSWAHDERSSSPLSDLPDDFELEEMLAELDPVSDELHESVEVVGNVSTKTRDPSPSPAAAPTSEPVPQLPAHPDPSPDTQSELTTLPASAPESESVFPTESKAAIISLSRKELHLHPTDSAAPTRVCTAPLTTPEAAADATVIDEDVKPIAQDNMIPRAEDVDVVMAVIAPLASSSANKSPSVPLPLAEAEEGMEIDDDARVQVKTKVQKRKESTLKDRNGVLQRASSSSSIGSSSSADAVKNTVTEKRKKKEQRAEGPTKKRRKTEVGRDSSEPTSISKVKNGKRKATEEAENDRSSEAPSASAAPKPKKRKQVEDKAPATASASTSTSTKRASKPQRKARAPSSNPEDESEPMEDSFDEPLDAEAIALHSTICGMAIETMAMSRASSLAVSSIYKLAMREQPGLKAQRTDCEWMRVFERVLRDGEAGTGRKGSGVFGKVESSGKDERSGKAFEAQWFYVPEMDEDQERAALIRSMMPRPAKRSETKKYKQYYWKPLDKISRWDPEDEL